MPQPLSRSQPVSCLTNCQRPSQHRWHSLVRSYTLPQTQAHPVFSSTFRNRSPDTLWWGPTLSEGSANTSSHMTPYTVTCHHVQCHRPSLTQCAGSVTASSYKVVPSRSHWGPPALSHTGTSLSQLHAVSSLTASPHPTYTVLSHTATHIVTAPVSRRCSVQSQAPHTRWRGLARPLGSRQTFSHTTPSSSPSASSVRVTPCSAPRQVGPGPGLDLAETTELTKARLRAAPRRVFWEVESRVWPGRRRACWERPLGRGFPGVQASLQDSNPFSSGLQSQNVFRLRRRSLLGRVSQASVGGGRGEARVRMCCADWRVSCL